MARARKGGVRDETTYPETRSEADVRLNLFAISESYVVAIRIDGPTQQFYNLALETYRRVKN